MPYTELLARIRKWYGPILDLEAAFPREKRIGIEQTLTIVLALLFMAMLLSVLIGKAGALTGSGPALAIAREAHRIYGAFMIVFAARFVFTALEAFRRSYYFRGIEHVLPDAAPKEGVVSYAVADISRTTSPLDITGGYLGSFFGQEVLARAGVDVEKFRSYAEGRTPTLPGSAFAITSGSAVTLSDYSVSIFEQDKDFANFLLSQEITKEELQGSAEWVERAEIAARKLERWWSRDELGRIEGLGKDFAYGVAFMLEKYGNPMVKDPMYKVAEATKREEDDEVEAMETALCKAKEANVLLIGKDIVQATLSVARLTAKIRSGKALPPIEYKHIYKLDPNAIIAAKKTKPEIEAEVRKVFQQAHDAGNIILLLENLPAIIKSAEIAGIDFVEIIRPFLLSPSLQVIATSEEDAAHGNVERSTAVMQFFEVVRMHDMDDAGVLSILEQTAIKEEGKHGVLVTYPALVATVKSAERYFPDGVMPDKAIDLLEEAIPYAAEHGTDRLTDALILEMVEGKTGVPLGKAEGQEKDKLINLESILHERVIGQDSAVTSIAKAMRRARSGIGNPNRPLGSFLFLGPTGVGKTETAKALAFAMFNDEEAMLRLDMSEYSGPDAVERLIGSFDGGAAGVLSSMLREKQYGVLLLDEFEKSQQKVHDLFLQVLDEGQFSDVNGKKINARNLVIIATSNAAADLIFKMNEQGIDPATQDDSIINAIVERGIYRPELLNRFDGTIVFHPLSTDNIAKIARIKLMGLAKRLIEKGITLAITDELVAIAAKEGFDQKFGARPMNRFIQEHVEQAVADKMLAGTVSAGSQITLTATDLAK